MEKRILFNLINNQTLLNKELNKKKKWKNEDLSKAITKISKEVYSSLGNTEDNDVQIKEDQEKIKQEVAGALAYIYTPKVSKGKYPKIRFKKGPSNKDFLDYLTEPGNEKKFGEYRNHLQAG